MTIQDWSIDGLFIHFSNSDRIFLYQKFRGTTVPSVEKLLQNLLSRIKITRLSNTPFNYSRISLVRVSPFLHRKFTIHRVFIGTRKTTSFLSRLLEESLIPSWKEDGTQNSIRYNFMQSHQKYFNAVRDTRYAAVSRDYEKGTRKREKGEAGREIWRVFKRLGLVHGPLLRFSSIFQCPRVS